MRFTASDHARTVSAVTDPPPQYPPYPAQTGPSGPFHPPARRGLPAGAIIGIVVAGLVILMCAGITIVGAVNQRTGPTNASDAADAAAPAPWTPEPTASRSLTVGLGETIVYESRLSDKEIHYTVSTAGKSITQTKYGTKPDRGAFFAVAVTIQAVKGSTYACPCDFALVTKDGAVYEPMVIGIDGMLDAVQINTGQRAAGLVVWDVPAAAIAGARIELRASLFANGQGFWQLP